jgi:hypothetical protein
MKQQEHDEVTRQHRWTPPCTLLANGSNWAGCVCQPFVELCTASPLWPVCARRAVALLAQLLELLLICHGWMLRGILFAYSSFLNI